ncbi:hypothetical protein DSO57_1016909 [Entomophthora muscae]|uniref:Uncharacterized protein n=1 Tax=Entomophthora muscae TaxID=34485 RepID=A0ACC2T4N4_9FUNG|nr:hypothetical protein DSO57_1016909 [Entomophthora muscae]
MSGEHNFSNCFTPAKRPRTQIADETHARGSSLEHVQVSHNVHPINKEAQSAAINTQESGKVPGVVDLTTESSSNFDSEELLAPFAKPLWIQVLSKFLGQLNLDQTQRALDTEMLILPASLYHSADSLLLLTLEEFKVHGLLATKQPLVSTEHDGSLLDKNANDVFQPEAKVISSVEYDISEEEMESRVQSFTKQMKDKSSQNNSEYIENTHLHSCARVNTSTTNQNLKKIQIIHNRHGPLLPTIQKGPSHQAKELKALSHTIGNPFEAEVSALAFPTVVERLENIETHLNLIIGTYSYAHP